MSVFISVTLVQILLLGPLTIPSIATGGYNRNCAWFARRLASSDEHFVNNETKIN